MKYLLIAISILFLTSSAIAENTPKPHFWGKYASEEEYTAAFNDGLKKSQEFKKEAAKHQGKIDWMIFLFILSALIIPTVLSFLKKNRLKITFFHFLVWSPFLVSIASMFPFMVSGGDWGSLKHPVLHDYFSDFEFKYLIMKLNIYLMPLVSVVIYTFLFRDGRIQISNIVLSASLYVLMYLGLLLFMSVLGGLASQGAGH